MGGLLFVLFDIIAYAIWLAGIIHWQLNLAFFRLYLRSLEMIDFRFELFGINNSLWRPKTEKEIDFFFVFFFFCLFVCFLVCSFVKLGSSGKKSSNEVDVIEVEKEKIRDTACPPRSTIVTVTAYVPASAVVLRSSSISKEKKNKKKIIKK